ncbi:DUF1918 domain-containing protein [Kibdelosporangium aridum]|uniref:DUF1918 domain-containing protein n=1 Tax=Kibdelosporangium aridum TaxID=2030 RepID=UPI00163C21A5
MCCGQTRTPSGRRLTGRQRREAGRRVPKGEIVQLVHDDGAPQFYVHWLDTGRVTLTGRWRPYARCGRRAAARMPVRIRRTRQPPLGNR